MTDDGAGPYSPLLALPEAALANILLFLRPSEAAPLTQLCGALHRLNIWADYCRVFGLPHPGGAPPGAARRAFYRALRAACLVGEGGLDITWGDTPAYWTRGLQLRAPLPPALVLMPSVARLEHVWWLSISGSLRVPAAGAVEVFLALAPAAGGAATLGSLNRSVQLAPAAAAPGGGAGGAAEEGAEPPPPLLLPRVDSTELFAASAGGAVWLHLGGVEVPAGGAVVAFRCFDTDATMKRGALVFGAEVLPRRLLSAEQREAVARGWARAGRGGLCQLL